jgi:hypothetical protein
MDTLTLELLDVTVFQALLELRGLLADHPGEAMRIRGEDDLLRVNVTGFLEKQGRIVRPVREGGHWELHVAQGARPVAVAPPVVRTARPLLLLRSAFAPGDRALGRRLLLETLSRVETGVPWLCLAHQAVELLEDPSAVAVLKAVQQRGVPVQVSSASLVDGGLESAGFDLVPDEAWQRLLVRGEVTVL